MTLVMLSEPASARPSAQLLYERGPGAEACPDESGLRLAVATRLGYDPFVADDPRHVMARVREAQGTLRATVELRSGEGKVTGRRELVSNTKDCSELFQTMTLTISIAVDPMHVAPQPGGAPPPTAEPSPAESAPAPAPATNDIPAPPPAASKQESVTPRLGGGLLAAIGALPGAGPGLFLFGGLRWRTFTIDLEGRADLPRSRDSGGGGAVRATLITGSLVPCFAPSIFLACATFSGGVIHGEGEDVDLTRDQTTAYASVGLRAGIEPRLSDRMRLRIHVDGATPLTPTTLSVNHSEAWESPRVNGALAVGLVGAFL